MYWSPDGRRLLHYSEGAWAVSAFDGSTPGTPVVIVTNPPSVDPQLYGNGVPQFAWSGDSQSLATVAAKTLSVFDPSQANPPQRALTTTLKSFRWAPTGSLLLYVDATGSHVVKVASGVAGAPQDVDASATVWSPTGTELAGIKGPDVTLTRLGGGAPVLLTLTQQSTPDQYVQAVSFNGDGSMLEFTGARDRQLPDVYVVKLGVTPAAPVRIHPAPPDGEMSGVTGGWSADGKWLLYVRTRLDDFQSQGLFAVNVSGANPAAPITLNVPAAFGTPSWSPIATAALVPSGSGTTVNLFKLPSPDPAVLFSDSALSGYRLSPAGDVLASRTPTALHFVSLDAPQNPKTVEIDAPSGTIGDWQWSPDGRFVSFVDTTRQQRLVRVMNGMPSTALPVHTKSKIAPISSWQP
jgi:Tol biopolymer transport system component